MQDVLIGKVCSGGLFEKVEIEEAHALRWEVRSLRAKIAEAVRRTAIVRELQIVPRAWQIEMAAGMLEKRDGLCLTKTGDGKTYCFLVAAMYEPSLIFMVVSPLIALMQDQVGFMDWSHIIQRLTQFRCARLRRVALKLWHCVVKTCKKTRRLLYQLLQANSNWYL